MTQDSARWLWAAGAILLWLALIALIDRLEALHGPAACLLAARLIAQAALDRHESRGGHYRADYPQTAANAAHTRIRLAGDLALAAE